MVSLLKVVAMKVEWNGLGFGLRLAAFFGIDDGLDLPADDVEVVPDVELHEGGQAVEGQVRVHEPPDGEGVGVFEQVEVAEDLVVVRLAGDVRRRPGPEAGVDDGEEDDDPPSHAGRPSGSLKT